MRQPDIILIFLIHLRSFKIQGHFTDFFVLQVLFFRRLAVFLVPNFGRKNPGVLRSASQGQGSPWLLWQCFAHTSIHPAFAQDPSQPKGVRVEVNAMLGFERLKLGRVAAYVHIKCMYGCGSGGMISAISSIMLKQCFSVSFCPASLIKGWI